MYINVIFQTISFYITQAPSGLVVSHSYLCIWVNCCSIISQVIIYLKVLKSWISILNLALFCSTLPVTLLILDSIFLPLFCLTPRVAVDLSPFQSLPLWFAEHRVYLLVVEKSTRSACCSVASGGYLNTLTVVGLVLVSSCFIHPRFWVFNLFLIALNSV